MDDLNIWNLREGVSIRLTKSFRDCHRQEFVEGTVLHFVSRDYLPYHSGHTVVFDEATMYLCDLDETGVVVENQGKEYYVLSDT